MTEWEPLPASGAWRHGAARNGVEVAFFSVSPDGLLVEGSTAAVDDGTVWTVAYVVEVDGQWRTRGAHLSVHTVTGRRVVTVRTDGAGHWTVDGLTVAALDGCLDIDLEASAVTNALPVRRLALTIGDSADAPAVYVRADGSVERLEQRYERTGERDFAYAAPAFDFASTLVYDAAGLVVDYPGIATRLA